MSADSLKSLIEDHPALRAVVFADLSTRMVLVSESRVQMLREALQALCQRAAETLTAVDSDPLDPETACDAAISLREDGLGVFLRVPGAPNDALCCVCEPTIDLDAFLEDARACLDGIVSA
jgi:hypothetical protein